MKQKPRKPLRIKGQYASQEQYDAWHKELATRKREALHSPGRTYAVNNFLDRAFEKRQEPEFEKRRKKLGVRKVRRDLPILVQAKSERRKVHHRTFRTKEAALVYLEQFSEPENFVAWFSLSARIDTGLFSYQSPVGSILETHLELKKAGQGLRTSKDNTDMRVAKSLESPDLRLTVYTLEVKPSPQPKASNAKRNKKRVGNKTRSGKRANGGQARSGKAGHSGGDHRRSNARTVSGEPASGKRSGTGKRVLKKGVGRIARRTAKKRGKAHRSRARTRGP